MIFTHSKFYYVEEITGDNRFISFDEGGGELIGTLEIGGYTMTELAQAVEDAMNAVGGQVYTVTFNRDTRTIEISASSNFDLLVSTGTVIGQGVFTTIGFTGADRTGANTYTGDAFGTEYSTQFKLQSYVEPDDFQQSAFAVVNKTALGEVEVVKFGQELFYEMEFKYITSAPQSPDGPIRNRSTGLEDFRNLMKFLINKRPLEFMPNENDVDTFDKVLLESTASDSKGIGYKLRELFNRNLPGYYDSGLVKFRVIE